LKIESKLFFIIFTSLLTSIGPVYGECLVPFCNKLEEINNNESEKELLITSNYQTSITLSNTNIEKLKILLREESTGLKYLFNNLLFSNVDEEKIYKANSQLFYDIESDTQYVQDDIFYAEGNVYLFLPYGIFKADKISYDSKNKIFKAYDNLKFDKGRQYFTADYLEYDLKLYKGRLDNVYGIVDFTSIPKDLGIVIQNKENKCNEKTSNLIDLPAEVELLNSQNLSLKNRQLRQEVGFDFSKITHWRFKADQINFNNGKLESELIYFTNDPFNKPQFMVRSKDFTAEKVLDKKVFQSNQTYIDFDEKISLPIGKRTISDRGVSSKWGVGYETKDKDGFYINRESEPIEIGKNFSLNIKQYFLIQRLITGESNAFRNNDSSVVSKKIKTDIDFLDYFSTNAKFSGELSQFNIESDLDIKTFNPKRFYDAFSFDFNVSKNIYSYSNIKEESEKDCIVSDSKKTAENFKIDIGYYSLFNRDNLYLGNGLKILNQYNFERNNFKKDYSLIIDFGQFKGKSLSNQEKLKELSRFGYIVSFAHDYQISNFNNDSEKYSISYKNTPKLIDKGLFLSSKISSGFYQYSNSESQNIISFSVGPKLQIGNLKKNLFDYTKISVKPEFLVKNKQSPFQFDDFNNDSRLKIEFSQQLYGPIILSFEGDYNINNNSSNYGLIENKNYSLFLSRRAYSINLKYFENNKSILLGFEIFNFGSDNKSPKF